MTDFRDRCVIVTGSSSGIGESTAILFASRGANVTVCGRDKTRLQRVVDSCLHAGQDAGHTNRVIAVPGDLTSAHVRVDTIKKTVETFGQLDVLVANHGGQFLTSNLDDVTEQNYDKNMDMNVKSVLFLIKEAVPHLEKTGGSVVVTSSLASTLSGVQNIAYHMGKAAVDHMVRCLSLELGPKGIRINAINPTLVGSTRIARDYRADLFKTGMGKFFCDSHPLRARSSTPEEQGEVILFLASDAARFVTGECVKVDGAMANKGYPRNFYQGPLAS
ncbi:hypothetical protein RRG08_020820 [Elysia crispata]|uniref:Uncharacterized protein n=1 Tax=Elysia crispata TaxID=231223 RepID=A0AAE1CMT3_9GAST|nr:hypothetical protein RRG08_020820 [Elysia crispata]